MKTKKLISLTLSFVMLAMTVLCVPFSAGAADLSGAIAVETKEDFYNMRNNASASYYLANDIVFDDSDFISHGDYYNNGKFFQAMDSFNGVLDGRGHTVYNLKGDYAIADSNNGTVKNLEINGCTLSGGAIADDNNGLISNVRAIDSTITHGIVFSNESNGIMEHCYTEGTDAPMCEYNSGEINYCKNASDISSSKYDYVCGIANYSGDGAIYRCINTGNISGKNASGITTDLNGYYGNDGQPADGIARECLNEGTVKATDTAAGIAISDYSCVPTDCLNTGVVTGNSSYGISSGRSVLNCVNTGLIQNGKGYAVGYYDNTDCYALNGSGLNSYSSNYDQAVFLTAEQMKQQSSFPMLDFKGTWETTDSGIALQGLSSKPLSLALYSAPEKQYYTPGEKLNLDGLTVMEFSSYGEWKIVDDYTVSGFTGSLGINTVTVEKDGVSATFDVLVRDQISNAKISLKQTKFTANGKSITPQVTAVSSSGKVLALNKDYTVAYTNNKYPGIATATITGKGSYTGTVKKNFTIMPAQVSGLKTTKRSTTALTLSWTKQSGVSGYVVQKYDSKNKKWVTCKTVTSNTNSLSLSKLSAATTYSFRVRSYKKLSGQTLYGSYSATLKTPTSPNKISSLKFTCDVYPKKRKASQTVRWKKQSGVSGYELKFYNMDYDDSYYLEKTKTINKASTCSYTYKVTYGTGEGYARVKVRSYKVVNGKKYYGAWSTANIKYVTHK